MNTQIIVDEHFDHALVTNPLKSWITAEQIGFKVGQKGLSDERIIPMLRAFKRCTLITLDDWFYDPKLQDANYCLVYFDMATSRQAEIPDLLRRLFRLSGFRTIRERMAKQLKCILRQGCSSTS